MSLKISKYFHPQGYVTRIVSPRGEFHSRVEFAPVFGKTCLSVYMFNRGEILTLPLLGPCRPALTNSFYRSNACVIMLLSNYVVTLSRSGTKTLGVKLGSRRQRICFSFSFNFPFVFHLFHLFHTSFSPFQVIVKNKKFVRSSYILVLKYNRNHSSTDYAITSLIIQDHNLLVIT